MQFKLFGLAVTVETLKKQDKEAQKVVYFPPQKAILEGSCLK
jgi:hypothetical protein